MKKLAAHKSIQESLLFFVLSLSLLAYSLWGQYGGSAIPWKLSPYLFPTLISLLLLLLSASLFRDGLRELRAGCAEAPMDKQNLRGVLTVTGAAVLYCVLMPLVGFFLSTVVFLAGLLWYLGERRRYLIAAIAIGCAGLCYLVFDLLLRVMLP